MGEMTEEPFMDFEGAEMAAETKVEAGKDVELECSVTGSPPPTIQWYKDGKAIILKPSALGSPPRVALLRSQDAVDVEDEASVGTEVEQVANQGLPTIQTATTNSRIRLPCVGPEAAGRYTCAASNGIAPAVSRNTTLVVPDSNAAVLCPKSRRSLRQGEPAKIRMWTDMRLERWDAVAQLFCRASGFPAPKITWYLLDDDMTTRHFIQPSKSFIFLRNGDLMVREPEPSDQGGFTFLCEARNPYGVDTKIITLVDVSYDGPAS